MQLTKYEHSCFTVEKDGQLLVVDPGGFTSDFIAPAGVVAILVTHEHPDHFDHEQLEAIINENPDAVIIGPESITSAIEVFTTHTVDQGDTFDIGPFHLEFFGGQHAVVHPSIPVIASVGVMINELLYYPSDSLTLPGRPVDTLALPIDAPWLKISESIDFLKQVRPRFVFPVHDAILSQIGKELFDGALGNTTKAQGGTYQRPTETITI